MFDIAWSELGVIAVVALLVIGPKDLPKVLRSIGQWTAKARAMAREFQSGIDDMVREAELDDLRKAAKDVSSFSLQDEVKKTIDPDGSLERTLNADALANAPSGDVPSTPAVLAAETPAPVEAQAAETQAAETQAAETPKVESPVVPEAGSQKP